MSLYIYILKKGCADGGVLWGAPCQRRGPKESGLFVCMCVCVCVFVDVCVCNLKNLCAYVCISTYLYVCK